MRSVSGQPIRFGGALSTLADRASRSNIQKSGLSGDHFAGSCFIAIGVTCRLDSRSLTSVNGDKLVLAKG
jgi:hypothetical protein